MVELRRFQFSHVARPCHCLHWCLVHRAACHIFQGLLCDEFSRGSQGQSNIGLSSLSLLHMVEVGFLLHNDRRIISHEDHGTLFYSWALDR